MGALRLEDGEGGVTGGWKGAGCFVVGFDGESGVVQEEAATMAGGGHGESGELFGVALGAKAMAGAAARMARESFILSFLVVCYTFGCLFYGV